jgi:hypothetical protein
MAGQDFELLQQPASAWRNDPRWGLIWKRANTLDAWGGIATRGELAIGNFDPVGPPSLYELRATLTYGPDDPAWPHGVDGMLKVKILSRVGYANHALICDLDNGMNIIIPGGVITVSVQQDQPISRYVDSISISIARSYGAKANATYSVFLAGIPAPGLPLGYLMTLAYVPEHAKRMRVSVPTNSGNVYVQWMCHSGPSLAIYDSGTHPEMLGVEGIPIPPNAEYCQIGYTPGPGGSVATFVIE